MEPDTSSNQRPVIQAGEILAKIGRGEDVKDDGVIIEGELDIGGLELPTNQVDSKEALMKRLLNKNRVEAGGVVRNETEGNS